MYFVKKILIYITFFVMFLSAQGNSNESNPYKKNFDEIFNIGKCYHMIKSSHYFLNLERKLF